MQRAAERGNLSSEGDAPEVSAESMQSKAARKRDEQLQQLVDDYNVKKRPAPMVDTHLANKKVAVPYPVLNIDQFIDLCF